MNMRYSYGKIDKIMVTVSIGISESRITDESNADIIKRADRALYYAKEHGRNKSIIFEMVYF